MTASKKLKLIPIMATLITALLFSGCHLPTGNHDSDLPKNPQNFTTTENDEMDSMVITIGDRTYAPYGRVNHRMDNGTVRECLGYIDGDKISARIDDMIYISAQGEVLADCDLSFEDMYYYKECDINELRGYVIERLKGIESQKN